MKMGTREGAYKRERESIQERGKRVRYCDEDINLLISQCHVTLLLCVSFHM